MVGREGSLKSLAARLLTTSLVFGLAWCLLHFAMAEYFWHRASECYRVEHYEQAIVFYNRALAWANPCYLNDPECLYCARGNAFDMAGRLDLALSDYNEALRLDPSSPRFYNEKAVAYRRSKRYKEAVATMDRALALPNARPRDYLERADSLIALADYQKAISDLDHYLTLAPAEKPQDQFRHSRGYDLRGWAYFKLGDFPKALADYESALKIRPGYAQALHDRGDVKQAQGDSAAAQGDYDLARTAGYKE